MCSRKSDIENERLPPELVDAESAEGKLLMGSGSVPQTPSEFNHDAAPPINANGVAAGLEKAIASGSVPSSPLSRINTSPAVGPLTSSGSSSPITSSPIGGGFKRGHHRQQSLGTTMTSPSTRRRSLESTMSLIQGVLEGTEKEDEQMDGLTSRLAGSSVENSSGAGSRGPAR